MSALGRSDRKDVTLTRVLKCAELRRTDASVEKRGARFETRESKCNGEAKTNGRWSKQGFSTHVLCLKNCLLGPS